MKNFYRSLKNHLICGATLTELVIATAVFGFISVGLLAIIQYGTKSWRQVESRFEVEKGIRRSVMDLNYNLRNTTMTSVTAGLEEEGIGNTPIPWVAFQISALIDSDGNILEDRLQYDLTDMKIQYNFFVLYYLMPPLENGTFHCSECARLGNTVAGLCPHKWLVKRFFYKLPASAAVPGKLKSEVFSDDIKYIVASDSSEPNTKNVKLCLREPNIAQGDRVLSKSMMDFRVWYNDSISSPARTYVTAGRTAQANAVQYTVRAFKALEATQAKVNITLTNESSTFSNLAFVNKYTVQIDQSVVPLNSKK